MNEPTFTRGHEVFASWFDDIQHNRKPVLWPVDNWGVEIGPGRLVVLAAAPGSGKTTLATQWMMDILRQKADVFAVIQNIEMSPGALMDKMLSRFSGVPLGDIYHRRELPAALKAKRDGAISIIRDFASRLYFTTGAASLDAAMETMKAAQSETGLSECLFIADYIQRISAGNAPGERESVNKTMAGLRLIAQAGGAVLAVSAAGRQKSENKPANYENLGLASFRGSSEIEFGADAAYILEPVKGDSGITRLSCVKNRFGDTGAVTVEFDKVRASFRPVELPDVTANIKKAWKQDDWAK